MRFSGKRDFFFQENKEAKLGEEPEWQKLLHAETNGKNTSLAGNHSTNCWGRKKIPLSYSESNAKSKQFRL